NDSRYLHGGAAQPLPARMLRNHTNLDAVIAVNVMPTGTDISDCLNAYPSPPPDPVGMSAKLRRFLNRNPNLLAYGNVLDTFKRCLSAAQLRLLASESAEADVLIHPYLCESRWYDYENYQSYIEAGRKAAREALPYIHALMNLKSSSHSSS